jgi:hypothetical protein
MVKSFHEELDCLKIILELKRLKREVELMKLTPSSSISSSSVRSSIKDNSEEINNNSRKENYRIEKDESNLFEEAKL